MYKLELTREEYECLATICGYIGGSPGFRREFTTKIWSFYQSDPKLARNYIKKCMALSDKIESYVSPSIEIEKVDDNFIITMDDYAVNCLFTILKNICKYEPGVNPLYTFVNLLIDEMRGVKKIYDYAEIIFEPLILK